MECPDTVLYKMAQKTSVDLIKSLLEYLRDMEVTIKRLEEAGETHNLYKMQLAVSVMVEETQLTKVEIDNIMQSDDDLLKAAHEFVDKLRESENKQY